MVFIPVLLLFVLIQVADQRLTISNKTHDAINAMSNAMAELNRNSNNDAAATIKFDAMELEGREQEINDALKIKMAKERANDLTDVVNLLKEDWKCAKLQACAMIGEKGKCKEEDMNEEECKSDETGKCKREGKVCAKVDGTEVCAEVSKVSGLHGIEQPHCKVPIILGDKTVRCWIDSRKNICAKEGTKMCVEVKEKEEERMLFVEGVNGKKVMMRMIEHSRRKARANLGKDKEIELLIERYSRMECTEKGCGGWMKLVPLAKMRLLGWGSDGELIPHVVDSNEACVKECAKLGGTKEKCVQLCAIFWNECTNQQVAKWQAEVLALMQDTTVHKMQKCLKQCSMDNCLAVCDTDEECAKNCTQYYKECKNACMAEPEKPCEKCKCTKYETKASVRVCNTNGTCHEASWETCAKWWSTVCKWHKRCFRDQDCGETGFCDGGGPELGKCDCTSIEDDPLACIQGEKCIAKKGWYKTVPPCGGLEGACNKTSNLCDCEMGFRKAGYNGTADAMANFCAKKECYGDPERETTDDCFGFPCMSGLCMCESKDNKESVNLASRKYPEEHKNSKFVMQKLEKSSLRDLKEETDYDYVDISVNEHIEEEEADLGAEVLVHECGKMVFVSAARAKGDRNENVSIWANYSKDLSFLDYCCYKWDSILIKKFGPGEINNGENIDATIEHVKFGYELPGKNLTREQQLGAKYKYGFSLAERPRLVNQLQPYRRSCKFSSKCLFPIDGCFIGPPKLSVEQSEEHKVNIQFSDDDGTKWENGSRLVQVRQWAIRCDCSNAKEGTNGLMRQLKFSTPRIYAAVIDNEAKQQRDTKIGDLVNTVTVDSRTKVTRDSSGRPFILYNAKEWKGI